MAEVDVLGAVKRPMAYELVGGETVADVIAMAGSFSELRFPPRRFLRASPVNWACHQLAPWI